MNNRFHLFIFRGRRQEDKPCASADVLLKILTPRERPGAFEHEFDAQLLPGKIQRVAVAQRPQLAAGDHQIVSIDLDGLRVPSVHRVEAKQVGEVLDVDQVVDRDQLDRWLVDHQLQDCASDSSQTVDGDFDAHLEFPTSRLVSIRERGVRFRGNSLPCHRVSRACHHIFCPWTRTSSKIAAIIKRRPNLVLDLFRPNSEMQIQYRRRPQLHSLWLGKSSMSRSVTNIRRCHEKYGHSTTSLEPCTLGLKATPVGTTIQCVNAR